MIELKIIERCEGVSIDKVVGNANDDKDVSLGKVINDKMDVDLSNQVRMAKEMLMSTYQVMILAHTSHLMTQVDMRNKKL